LIVAGLNAAWFAKGPLGLDLIVGFSFEVGYYEHLASLGPARLA